jgi:YYY domain-containing protein
MEMMSADTKTGEAVKDPGSNNGDAATAKQDATDSPPGVFGFLKIVFKKRYAALALLAILLLAAYFRFTGLDWDDTYHLHPDERFLTDVATLIKSTDPLTYLRTSESPLNPYNVDRSFYVYGNFPMTVTRYVAELANGVCENFQELCTPNLIYYDGVHLVGRSLSALADLVSIVFVFLIGRRLYDRRAGLIAALLMAVAVLPIQQSHFFTMDNWAAALTTITLYIAVRASESGNQKRWWLLFGIALGLTVASRINVAPLAVMAVVAATIWLARRAAADPGRQGWRYLLTGPGSADLQSAVFGVLLAAILSLITFRLAQPYAFADAQIVRETALAETGQLPGLLRSIVGPLVTLNPQWWANMTEIRGLQSPEASFPPALQWANRTPILFPLTNMVIWGMGLSAGIAVVLAFLWALWRIVRARPDWTNHALLVSWAGLYFLFMSTRWVKSIRYFLPIYPALFILAGWALLEIWKRAGKRNTRRLAALVLIAVVVLPALAWANTFVKIYREPVTRVQASAWIFENVPTGATLVYETGGASRELHLPLRAYDFVPGGPPMVLNFTAPEAGSLIGLRFNYLSDPESGSEPDAGESLNVSLLESSTGRILAEGSKDLVLTDQPQQALLELEGVTLSPGESYALLAEAGSGGSFAAGTSVLANEHWDDSLPVRYEGRDPYWNYYNGVTEGQIPITNPDGEQKREDFSRWLEESDYIVLSSQRALWSLPRLPLTYPMTQRYYEALFAGELGFELVEHFAPDFHIGPLYISDTTGQFSWGAPAVTGWPPPGDLAVEEAFSVYDHPPVWIFAKTENYSPEAVRQVLAPVDLSQAVFMTPGQATQAPNGLMLSTEDLARQRENGAFSTIFNPDGLLAQNPGLAAVVWWLAVVLLGWLVFPIAFVVFRGLPDRGYPLARILSLLLVSYFGWLAASLKLLPNTRGTLALGLLLIAFASAFILLRRGRAILGFLRANLSYLLVVELLSVALYGLFIVVRLGNPDVWDVIWGGEKPMDLSYFNAVLKSSFFPPYDPWYAGGYINYYYYGFVYVGSLTKLLGIIPAVAYNLILPMLFSFTGLGAFSIAYNLVARGAKQRRRQPPNDPSNGKRRHLFPGLIRKAVAAGLVATLLIIIVGNLAQVTVILNSWYQTGDSTINTGIAPVDTVIQTVDGALAVTFTDRVAPIYTGDWFWTATRAINAEPGEVQPITEFPFFTFLYGDLHAHMIALPLTLLALAWAVSLALRERPAGGSSSIAAWEWALVWLIGALSIGVLRATNTWDFPTYLLIGLLAVVFHGYQSYGRVNLKMLGQVAIQSTALVALSVALFLPFAENYGVGYTSFSLWPGSFTFLGNYLLIYGLFLFLIITLLAREFRSWSKTWTSESLARWEPFAVPVMLGLAGLVIASILLLARGYWIAPIVLVLVSLSGILALRPNLAPQRRIPLILIAVSLGLTLVVEIIVLDGDIGRMNTVFKFYMQVWVMLSIVGGVSAIWAWPAVAARPRLRPWWRGTLALLLLAALLYPVLATKAKWDIRMNREAPTTLNGMSFMEVTSYGDTGFDGSSQTVDLAFDHDAIQWMQRNIDGSPVIAEAHSTNPYRTAANRVAMYTGLPAIVGWDWHQRQQRAVLPSNVVTNRINDLNALYSTTDSAEAKAILDKYDVGYVYVGQLEWIYYSPQGLLKFERMANEGILHEVYRNGGVTIYEVVL